MQFNKIGDLKLEAKIAVQLKLSLPPGVQLPTPDGKSGSLMMFEPKFVKMGPIPSNVKVRFGIDP